jgi:glucose/arabinose dehydrogenase
LRRLLFILALAATLAASLAQPGAGLAGEPTVAEGFVNEPVTPTFRGTALAFTPDGRLLVGSRNGQVRVFTDGALQDPPALDITSHTCSDNERGLLGLAVSPDFATDHYVYVYYTHTYDGSCPLGNVENPVNRVSRFVLNNDNTIDELSEDILLDNIYSVGGIHNAGDVEFGPDGYLYVSTGDNGRDYAGDSGFQDDNDASRDENVLIGKVLRVTADGEIPPDNPFLGEDSDRCGLTGETEPGRRCQETYGWGLRNPFRLAIDPNSEETRLFINDVGGGDWEEVNLGSPGADYGWNVREGLCSVETGECGDTPAGMTDPIYAYPHGTPCSAITAGAFVPDGLWSGYNGVYLYSDYMCARIFALTDPGGANTVTEIVHLADEMQMGPVEMVFGPHGDSQALYYLSNGGSQLYRLSRLGPEPVQLFEGWNQVTWTGPLVADDAIGPTIDAAVEPDVWVSVAVFDGQWLQWFADPPLPSFNTLDQILPEQEIWVFVTEDATFSP